MTVFADWVQVTTPADHWPALRDAVEPVLDLGGLHLVQDDSGSVFWRDFKGHGTVKAVRRGRVWSIGASGAVLASLRAAQILADYLAGLSSVPHRVTRLDAAMDVRGDAAHILPPLLEKGHAGELSLTRKSILHDQIIRIFKRRPDGVESGTVYFGSRDASARMVVYDKSLERADKCGEFIADTTRYELRLDGRTGITLRDCADPGPVFFHHASPSFLPRPAGVPDWSPHGSGYVLGQAPLPAYPAARLQRLVQDSPDIGRAINLAAEIGPAGWDFLLSQLGRRYRALMAVSPPGVVGNA